MAIPIKNTEQIAAMRESCKIVGECLKLVGQAIKPGMTTKDLDTIAAEFIESRGAKASFKGYNGFPESICVSVNDEVIHGIPGLKKIKDGDIVSIDIGAYKNGFHGDGARTFCVGAASAEARKLVDVTKQSFFEGMKFAAPGRHLYEVSAAIQSYVEQNGFSVVREFVGHGVGRQLHEEPQIPHYRQLSRGPRLQPGMTLAVEPMVNAGSREIRIGKDRWTVTTMDGRLSAHYENTVLITESGCEILTRDE